MLFFAVFAFALVAFVLGFLAFVGFRTVSTALRYSSLFFSSFIIGSQVVFRIRAALSIVNADGRRRFAGFFIFGNVSFRLRLIAERLSVEHVPGKVNADAVRPEKARELFLATLHIVVALDLRLELLGAGRSGDVAIAVGIRGIEARAGNFARERRANDLAVGAVDVDLPL